MWLWWLAAAQAASLTISGAGEARSVVLIAATPTRERAVLCTDDGVLPDRRAGDGLWSCPELALPGGGVLAALLDGRKLAGRVSIPEDTGQLCHLSLEGEGALTDRSPPPGEAGEPVPARAPLILEVEMGPVEQAWQISLEGDDQVREYRCSDDGQFPDYVLNDDVLTCAGPSPSRSLRLRLRGGGVDEESELTWPDGAAILFGRWTREGLAVYERRLIEVRAAGAPAPEVELPRVTPPAGASTIGGAPTPPPGSPTPMGPGGHAGGAPGGPGGLRWTAWVGLMLAGATSWRIWRGPASRRPPPGATRVMPPGPRLQRREAPELEAALAAAVEERAPSGPVLLVLPPGVTAPWAEAGPVLTADSPDALDILDALEGLLRRDPLCTPTVIVAGAQTLVNPSGLGVPPLDQLVENAPASARVLLLEEPS